MSKQRYTPEFKDEAVRQVLDRGYPVANVAGRLGVSACRRVGSQPVQVGEGGEAGQHRAAS